MNLTCILQWVLRWIYQIKSTYGIKSRMWWLIWIILWRGTAMGRCLVMMGTWSEYRAHNCQHVICVKWPIVILCTAYSCHRSYVLCVTRVIMTELIFEALCFRHGAFDPSFYCEITEDGRFVKNYQPLAWMIRHIVAGTDMFLHWCALYSSDRYITVNYIHKDRHLVNSLHKS